MAARSSTTPLPRDKTIYIYDPELNQIIPYKPDYTGGGIPLLASSSTMRGGLVNIEAVTQKPSTRATPRRDNQLGTFVSLVRIPPNQSDWIQTATFARKYPTVNTIAIVSPTRDERGIGDFGSGTDPVFQNGIATLVANSVIVVGYMDISQNVNKTLDDKKREVDRWRDWYPDVAGLYFDKVNPNNLDECAQLAAYAKVDRAFGYIIADLSSGYSGGVVNRDDDYLANTTPPMRDAVDIVVIYNRDGYPAESWYNSIRKIWMPQYPRSKFAFIVYRVSGSTLDARNFIDRIVGIEKLAGYVAIHPAPETDRRPLREWTSISTMLEISLEQLDREAKNEGMPALRGVALETIRPGTEGRGGETIQQAEFRQEGQPTIGASTEEPVSDDAVPRSEMALDKFGVRKIYPTLEGRTGFKEWYLFEENPGVDKAIRFSGTFSKQQQDASWRIIEGEEEKGKKKGKKKVKGPIRLEVWAPGKSRLTNVEMTGYFKISQFPTKKKERNVITQIARGGSGSAYKGLLMKDGLVAVAKQLFQEEKNRTTINTRGTTVATTNDILNRWIGLKYMVYNYPKYNQQTGKEETAVTMEIWVDDNVTDPSNGGLVVKNDWRHMLIMRDEGGWGTDTVLEDAGGNVTDGNFAGWEFGEGAIVDFKFLSVREIDTVRRD